MTFLGGQQKKGTVRDVQRVEQVSHFKEEHWIKSLEHRNTFHSTSRVQNELEELQAHGSLWENVCGCLSVLKILLILWNIQKTSWGKKKKEKKKHNSIITSKSMGLNKGV